MTTATATRTAVQREAEPLRRLGALQERFPPRPFAVTWPQAMLSWQQVLARLGEAPFPAATTVGEQNRQRGLRIVLDWLQSQPGETWQQRWLASGAGYEGKADWRALPIRWRKSATDSDCRFDAQVLGSGLLSLMCAEVIRPDLAWLLTTATPKRLAAEIARTRDPGGFAELAARCQARPVGEATTRVALHRIAAIMAAKGGMIADITVGDCLQLLDIAAEVCDVPHYRSPYFYQLLHAVGAFGQQNNAPTVRALDGDRQRSVEQLIDRCGITCRPVRDLLVDYLRERQPSVDHVTLVRLADMLGRLFWRDLELHHPGIASLRLAAPIAAAWKQRIAAKTARRQVDGGLAEVSSQRHSALNCLAAVRAFYLDIAQWAADDPSRWAQWAVPCPIKAEDMQHRAEAARRKSRIDQRTRERLPVLPTLTAAAHTQRRDAADRLAAATATGPSQTFTAGGQTLRRVALTRGHAASVWAEEPDGGARRNLVREEDRAFWAWAAVEVLRHTGIRIEELTELTHSSLVQYRLPTTGELVPLLHIVPSKTDTERLIVISPELADVLSAIVCRVRDDTGTIPLVAAYDYHERVFNAPLPLLFQHPVGIENRPINAPAIRRLLDAMLAATGLTDAGGQPLRFVPHDFRRLFITDAVMNGMPPHIAQLVVGHRDINTTMGYKAVYPEETINGHRAFLARRRALRPSEEYRTPTDEEWEQFLGHFERRKVALGTCGRAFGTACIHEHACIRCSLLRPDPAHRQRLVEVHDNLLARIREAAREGWLGEVEGLRVSLAAAKRKLDELVAHRTTNLGIPSFPDVAGRTIGPDSGGR
jgi:hypothetical protein